MNRFVDRNYLMDIGEHAVHLVFLWFSSITHFLFSVFRLTQYWHTWKDSLLILVNVLLHTYSETHQVAVLLCCQQAYFLLHYYRYFRFLKFGHYRSKPYQGFRLTLSEVVSYCQDNRKYLGLTSSILLSVSYIIILIVYGIV